MNYYQSSSVPQQTAMYQHPGQYGYTNNTTYGASYPSQYYSQQPYYAPDYNYSGRPVQPNQNYYKGPIINNPPVNNSYEHYGVTDPYANYYANYYSQHGQHGAPYGEYYGAQQGGCAGCSQQAYGGYGGYGYYGNYGNYGGHAGCQGCQGGYQSSYASHHHQHGSKKDCGCGCGGAKKKDCGCGCGGAGNCGQYGYPYINRDRITPNFPSKLRHSYITSGDQVQNKLVINQPTVESAPFQTQRRKTYQPYTRKYIQYQDYIQYIPVQKSQWKYNKVMKQIDFVPQQYYQSQMQYVPIQKINQKVRYLPVEQQILHVPQDRMRKVDQRESKVINGPAGFGRTFDTYRLSSTVMRNSIPSSAGLPQTSQPANSNITTVNNNSAYKGSQFISQPSSLIQPAVSTVQMVPNSRLQPNQQFGVLPQNFVPSSNINQSNDGSYRFPSSGGVMIGSSSQANPAYNTAFSSFGPGVQQSSQVQQSALNPLQQTLVNKTTSQIVGQSNVYRDSQNSQLLQTSAHQKLNHSGSSIIKPQNDNNYRNSQHNQYDEYEESYTNEFPPQKKKSLVDNIDYEYYN